MSRDVIVFIILCCFICVYVEVLQSAGSHPWSPIKYLNDIILIVSFIITINSETEQSRRTKPLEVKKRVIN
jgi:hypothetical protein